MTGQASKLARIQDKYGIAELDDELINRYTDENASLRDLARYVNIELARQTLEQTGFSAFEVYQTLKDPDREYSEQERSDLRRRLRLEDIAVSELEDDWVSHMSVRTYLRKELGVNTERPETEPIKPDEALEQIRGLISREESIIRNTLRRVDGVDTEKWDLHTEVRIRNIDDGESIHLEELLKDLRSR